MPFVRRTAYRVPHDDDPVADVNRVQHRCQHANIGLRSGDNKRVGLALTEVFDQPGFGEGGIACFVDHRRKGAKRRKRWHQVQQSEIEAFAGRDAPARVIALPHARHLVWTRGRNEAGENRSFGMTARERISTRQDPVHPWRRLRAFGPKKSAACRCIGGRCARSAEE